LIEHSLCNADQLFDAGQVPPFVLNQLDHAGTLERREQPEAKVRLRGSAQARERPDLVI
jgi:hypothetical protein